jgi:hypothetical protein
MIPRLQCPYLSVGAVVLSAMLSVACEKVPFLAPTGSTITLTSATTALSINGTTTIVAQVLESSGTPPHSGTRVTFMSTLGRVEPSEISTDASGRAVVTFHAGTASGIAIITASSGGATTSTGGTGSGSTTGGTTSTDRNVRIAVGAAAVGRVNLSANPGVLPTSGGQVTVVANVLDINGNALASAPVTFTTTAGTLSATVSSTDAAGNAMVVLTTFQAATVTATVGVSVSGGSTGSTGGTTSGSSNTQASVAITLTSAPIVSITVPGSPPSAGLPSTYGVKVTPATTGSTGTGGSTSTIAIREVVISWGDGSSQSLGAVSGDQSVAHVYGRADTYTIVVTATDVAGGVGRVSTSVSVIPVPQPTVLVTPSLQSPRVNELVNFSINVTVPAGIGVQNTTINFGTGEETRQLGGATSVSVPKSYATPGARTVTVSVLDTIGRTTIGTAIVSVIP